MEFYTFFVYFLAYIGLFATFFYILNLKEFAKKEKVFLDEEGKTVTIIIPAYNESKSIERTIDSALSLNYPKEKLEIIVVDDGSKDNTYELAQRYASNKGIKVRVFTKKNGGKGSALNFGISKSKHEIIISMDADTFVEKDALRKMVAHFYSKDVMSVCPSMGVYKPKSIWQRVQQIEYYMGVFLRKSFAVINAVHITPGAFSAYRKSFFDKYGGYDEGNITEDLEIALRIQKHHYIIENSAESVVYTMVPKKFRELLIQRRRWYVGLMKNLYNYRELFGMKHGLLGILVLPLAIISVAVGVFLTSYVVVRTMSELKDELVFLNSINFDVGSVFDAGSYLTKHFFMTVLYNLFSNPVFLIALLFIGFLIFYLYFAKRRMKFKESLKLNFIFFVAMYSFLYSFWWIVSAIYTISNKKIVWREEIGAK